MNRSLPVAALAAGAAWIALLAGCAGGGPAPDPAVLAAHPETAHPQQPPWPVEVRVSAVANLYHWVDALAGSSRGKTDAVYQRYWQQRFGPLRPGDRKALELFRRIRNHALPALAPEDLPRDGSCLPAASLGLSRRQELTAAALRAKDLPELIVRAREILEPHEAAGLRLALEHFQPRFESLWPEMGFLPPFRDRLEAFLAAPASGELIRRYVTFLEASGAQAQPQPTEISLLALPRGGATHAEANGRFLLVEIRPRDSPELQVPVIFHELVHDLWRRAPSQMRNRLAERFFSRGAPGALAWSLLHEGLPTALGQGLARASLAPRTFSFEDLWYHLPEIDRFAHEIYPVVRQEVHSRRDVAERLPDLIIDQVVAGRAGSPPIGAYLGHAAFVAGGKLLPSLRPFMRSSAGRAQFGIDLNHPDGRAFLSRFTCLPVVLLATERQLEEGLALPGGWEGADPGAFRLPQGAYGMIAPARRRSGAALLLLLARSEEDALRVVRRASHLVGWPEAPVLLR